MNDRIYDGAGTPLRANELEIMHRVAIDMPIDEAPRLKRAGLIEDTGGWMSSGYWGRWPALTPQGRLAYRAAILDGWTPPKRERVR